MKRSAPYWEPTFFMPYLLLKTYPITLPNSFAAAMLIPL